MGIQIDDLATRLTESAQRLDRSQLFPIAVAAILSGAGWLALRDFGDRCFSWLPFGRQELPVASTDQPEIAREQTQQALLIITRALGIPVQEIRTISGLPPHGTAEAPLLGRTIPGLQRQVYVVPYFVQLRSQPPLSQGGTWHGPAQALREIGRCPRQSERLIGATILERALSSPPRQA